MVLDEIEKASRTTNGQKGFQWRLFSPARGATARRWTGDGEQGDFNPNLEQRRQEKISPPSSPARLIRRRRSQPKNGE